MREILFRGKRIDNGEWVCGYYICKQDPLLPGIDTNVIVTFDENSMSVWNKVDPATVGQDTGLTDKNGKKIFEGDICYFTVFDCFDNDTQYRGVVVYSGSRFMLWKSVGSEYYGADGGFDLDWVIAQDDEFEIVGNIHDTPELLKEAGNAPQN